MVTGSVRNDSAGVLIDVEGEHAKIDALARYFNARLGNWGVRLRWQASWDIVQGNTIRNAGSGGIGMTQNTVYNVRISQNIVTDTNGQAILATFDSGSRSGSDMWIPAPVITSATTAKIQGTGIAGAEVEVYRATRSANGSNSGLPQSYLGTAIVSSTGTWNLPVSGLNPFAIMAARASCMIAL